MRKNILTICTFLCCVTLFAEPTETVQPVAVGECANFSPEVKAFSAQLNASNKTMFCTKFNDQQRSDAMRMTGQMDSAGMVMMTPDQAVDKVARDNNLTAPGKTPGGCPVK